MTLRLPSLRRAGGAVVLVVSLAWISSTAPACDDLPTIDPNECGNTLVEPARGEACDTYARDASVSGAPTLCGAPGSVAECLYIHDDEHDCPEGYGAGVDGVCRRPTWTFASAPMTVLPTTGWTNIVRDFDADGLDDLLVTRPLAPEARVYTFGSGGALRDTIAVSTPLSILPLVAAQMSDDLRPELVIPDSAGLQVLRNQSGLTFGPKAYASLPVPAKSQPVAIPTSAEVFSGDDLKQAPDKHYGGLVTSDGGGLSFVVPELDGGGLVEVASIPGYDLEDIVGLVKADLDADVIGALVPVPSDELVVGLRGATALGDAIIVLDPNADPLKRKMVKLDHFGTTLPPRRLVAGPFVAHKKNGDPLIAFAERGANGSGDIFVRFSHYDAATDALVLDPAEYPIFGGTPADSDVAQRLPLAVDVYQILLLGIPVLDLAITVDSAGLWFGFPNCNEPTGCFTKLALNQSFSPWTSAALDVGAGIVVAGSSASGGLDVLRLDTDGFSVNPSRVVTDRPTRQLVPGDYDGDGVEDYLVLSRSDESPSCEDDSQLSILWGTSPGHPKDVTALGALPGAAAAASGRILSLADFDGIDDFGVATTCAEGAEARVGIFYGAASRQLECPYSLLDDLPSLGELPNQGVVPLGAIALDPDDPTRESLLAVTYLNGELSLRVQHTSGDADLEPPEYNTIATADLADATAALLGGRIAVADVDGDELSDVVFFTVSLGPVEGSERAIVPTFYVGIQTAEGGFTFQSPVTLSSTFKVSWSGAVADAVAEAVYSLDSDVVATDLDGDGDVDVLGRVTLHDESAPSVALQDSGSWAESALTTADRDGQPIADVGLGGFFAAADPSAPLVIGSTIGPLLCAELVCTPIFDGAEPAIAAALGDFDGDGVLDLASFGFDATTLHHGISVEETSTVEDSQ
ncbi:MAG: hypothetical protein U0271_00315 [Polyangiaceae bacterium]